MANLKAIRRRIKSVQSTQKITRAMRLVAAAKVRRAQIRTLAARPFTASIIRMLQEVVAEVQPIDLKEIPLLRQRTVNKIGIIVLSSDRGLCGSYNTNIFRTTLERIQQLKTESKEAALILVGLKAVAFFRSLRVEKLKTYTLLPAFPTAAEANLIADQAAQMYVEGVVDAVEIIGTHFISLLRSAVVNNKFLPVELPSAQQNIGLTAKTLYEPTIEEVLSIQLLPKYIENFIFQSLLDAAASELAARMNAMSAASSNAQELINTLVLIYNKARQANITQELLEVVGGAEALKN